MTTRKRIDSHSTEFGLWLREQPELDSINFDCQNLDYVWFAYRDGWLITIEEKRHGSKPTIAQSDTHNIVQQMLTLASKISNTIDYKFQTMRGKRVISYLGHYLVQFEKTNPEDSEWIKINDKEYTKKELIFLLSYGKLISFRDLQAEDLLDFVDKINALGFNLGPGSLDPYFEEL